jgi:hypothetical protein
MARSVDLEGIADDGYGYTVKVTAPGQTQQAPSNNMWRIPSLNFGRKKMRISEDIAAKDALAIPILREVKVAESWKVAVEKEL